MKAPSDSLQTVIDQLKKLPGVGEKTATRFAHFIIRQPEIFAQELSESISEVRRRLQPCALCCTFTEEAMCRICADSSRLDDIICVVEGPSELLAFERSGQFRGKYHVLHGSFSPLEGISEQKLKLKELKSRVQQHGVKELVLATNPTVEGDTTALYIARMLRESGLKITRIAYGIPVGSEIEYLDGATLGKALQNRVPLTL